jgi:hypothetical protein
MQLLEDQRTRERKESEQRAIRLDLDKFNSQRLQHRQKDIQDALDGDLKLLAEFAALEIVEKNEHSRRRAQLRKETELYRQHLAEQKVIEQKKAKEIEKFYEIDNEKVFCGTH